MKWKTKKTTWVSVFQKYGKLWNISLGHFIKHKLLISEECTLTGCIVVFIIALSILIIPYGFLDYFEKTDSQMCAKISLWIFFVLLNSFYCGALTMFFSSEFRIPFISIEDVMKAYPSWKLKMLNGNDVHFQYKAIQVLQI